MDFLSIGLVSVKQLFVCCDHPILPHWVSFYVFLRASQNTAYKFGKVYDKQARREELTANKTVQGYTMIYTNYKAQSYITIYQLPDIKQQTMCPNMDIRTRISCIKPKYNRK